MKISTDTISGEEVDIGANARTGHWYVELNDENIASGDTLEKAKRQAAVEIRKRRVKVSVPFALQDGRRGIADGLHQRNRSVLATVDGTREDLGYNPKALRPDIPDERLDRIRAIDEETSTLQRERGGIVREYEIELSKLVGAAIQDTIDKQDAGKVGATDAS